MSRSNRGRWGMFQVALLASVLSFTAACAKKDAPAEEAGVSTQGIIVERAPADRVAARKREEARQKRADAAKDTPFSYFRYRIETTGESPVACFVFSAALDPEKDYSPFVEFRPAFKPALSVEGRELCVGGLAFGTDRTATLLEGLPSADGRQLTRAETVPIDFADRPPYVGFKGSGIILPRENADGLPIETVNVDAVTVTVERVNDRALAFKSINKGEDTARGSYFYRWGDDVPHDVSEQIFSGTMDIANVENAPVVTVFPIQDVIDPDQPGAYYVTVQEMDPASTGRGEPAGSRRWIMVTDLAITAYEGEQGLDVTLRSLKDGRPVPEIRVQLIAHNNDLLAEARTDEEGRVAFDGPIVSGKGNARPKLLLAYSAKGELAALDLSRAPVDLSEQNIDGRRPAGEVDSYIYTDRGIYRPGETVNLSAMIRDGQGRAIKNRSGHLVIFRPNGLQAEKIRFEGSESGAVIEDFELPAGANRGNWRADIKIDGMTSVAGTKYFSVEDFVPQRIAVDLELDEDTPIKDGIRDVTVNARFLYGAPGAGLTVQATSRVEPDPNPFEALEGFSFGRFDDNFHERIIEMDDVTTDGAGNAVLRLDPDGRGEAAARPLRLNTVVSVLEPGGRAVSESARIPYRPREAYLGLKRKTESTGSENRAMAYEVAAINADGDLIAADLNWKLLAIDYHYDWYREGGRWRWRRSRTVTVANEGVVKTADGATAEITADGLDYGAHELIIEGAEKGSPLIASASFYAGWGGFVSDDGTEAPDRVKVVSNDKAPEVGKIAEVSIMPPYAGEAQVVVATDRVLSVQNFSITEDGASLKLPVTEDWGAGAYVMVSVYSERDPILQAKPRRAVGLSYVSVDTKSRVFDVSMDIPDIARPRGEQVIEVQLENGPKEPVFMTLAAVDQGILSLTKFKSPDPVSYYFGKQALGVEMYDDYGRLLDPNMGLPAEVRTGGDALGGEGLTVVPVKSVALFSGLVDVGRDGKAKIPLNVPEFNGELRLMAVAWSDNGLGASEGTMIVRDAAPSDLVMPRFLAPGDEAVITASVDNVELESGQFKTLINGQGPINVNEGELTATLQKGQRIDAPVRISSTEEGIARLRMSVEGPNKYAVNRNYMIQSRSPYLPVSEISHATMEPGDSYAVDTGLLEGFVPGSTMVTVGFSSLPVDAASLYASLARYPYGCTEQTVSRAMPLLYSERLVAMGADKDGDDPRTRVQESITTLLNRQSAGGAFGLWREGDGYASPWLGAYTVDFLTRAKAEGYSVPDEALDRAYNSLKDIATGEQYRAYGYDTYVHDYRGATDTTEKLMQRSSAYALYVLSRVGQADVSRLHYMHDRGMGEIDSPLARAHIGTALALTGDRSRAVSAFESAVNALGYENDSDYYQTALRDLSGVLALAAEAGLTDTVTALVERLDKDIPDASRLTTQEKSFLLMAVSAMSEKDGEVKIDVKGLGRGMDNLHQYQLTEEQVKSGATFELKGKSPLFRTVMVTGSPEKAPRATSSKLGVEKRFYTLTGGRVDLSDVAQGEQLVVRISVSPEQNRLNPVIVADLLPAGFEIESVLNPADGRRDSGSGTFAFLGELAYPQTQQSQDDRFVAALNVTSETKRLAYVVRAVTPGTFAMPGVVAEDMYRPDVFGRSAPGAVTITSAPAPAAGGQ